MRALQRSLLATASALLGVAPVGAQAVTFKHIVIVIQENRTPDNLFGSNPTFEPGVDIATSGVNSKGQTVALTPTALAGCYDLSHTHLAFENMLTEGADKVPVNAQAGCTLPPNPQFTYIDNSTGILRPYFAIAEEYGFANRMFQTNQGPSFPAHQFLFGGTSAPSTESSLFAAENKEGKGAYGCIAPSTETVKVIDGTGSESTNAPIYPCFEHPTLGDVLDQAGVSWHYYTPHSGSIWTAPEAIQHMCAAVMVHQELVCKGPDWVNGTIVATNPAQVLTDVANCNLASVSWVIPTGAESDHATQTDGTGPQWVASVVNAVGEQPACANGETYWNDTAIFITWDDWGGWYDHVAPFIINQQPASAPAWGDGYTYGFRVPLMVVSAYTPRNYVDNTVHDFGSILYFVEHNFGLGSIGPGDTIYSSYADTQAQLRGDDMAGFFARHNARIFKPVPTALKPSYFLNQPTPTEGPDSD